MRAGDWAIGVEAWLLLGAVRLALSIVSTGRSTRWATRVSDPARARRNADVSRIVRRVARLSAMAARRHAPAMTCLPIAIVVARLLSRRGIDTTIQFGVRQTGEALTAHAWTEWRGRVIAGGVRSATDFMPLTSGIATAPHARLLTDRRRKSDA
jgi:hypothetical protein